MIASTVEDAAQRLCRLRVVPHGWAAAPIAFSRLSLDPHLTKTRQKFTSRNERHVFFKAAVIMEQDWSLPAETPRKLARWH
jgi:hypothetical protein